MHKHFFLIVLFLLSGNIIAAQEVVLFETDFNDDPLPAALTLSDGWSRADIDGEGVLVADSDTQEQLYFESGGDWQHYIVEFQLKIVSGAVSVHLRTDDDLCSSYGLVIEPSLRRLQLVKYEPDCSYDALRSRIFDFPLDALTNIAFQVAGMELTVWIEGERIFRLPNETYDRGLPMIKLYPDTEGRAVAQIDNLSVVEIEFAGAGEQESSSDEETTQESPPLAMYDARYTDTIAELQSLEIVPDGGYLVFEEDAAYFNGSGSFITPLARNSPRQDIVLAGTLDYDPGSGGTYGSCGFGVRVGPYVDGFTETFTDVALLESGTLMVAERYEGRSAGYDDVERFRLRLDLDESYRLIIIAIEDNVTVYLNGDLIIDDFPSIARAGTFGVYLTTDQAGSTCEASDIWVYTFDE